MIIDFHTHIFPPSFRRRRQSYVAKDATLAELFADPQAPMATAQELIAAMDEAGVDMAVVMGIGWASLEVAREANDYLLDSAARYPSRIIPFCSVNPAWGDAALREMERCAQLGARGVGELHPDTQGFSWSDEGVTGPFMEALRSHGMVLLTHSSEPVGHAYLGKGTVTPAVLMGLIERYPSAPIVCAHWGGGLPFYALMPEVRAALAHAYLDTAASPFLYRTKVYTVAASLVGAESILFGSDFPLLKPGRLMRQINAAALSQEEKRAILGGNAQRLLGLEGGVHGA